MTDMDIASLDAAHREISFTLLPRVCRLPAEVQNFVRPSCEAHRENGGRFVEEYREPATKAWKQWLANQEADICRTVDAASPLLKPWHGFICDMYGNEVVHLGDMDSPGGAVTGIYWHWLVIELAVKRLHWIWQTKQRPIDCIVELKETQCGIPFSVSEQNLRTRLQTEFSRIQYRAGLQAAATDAMEANCKSIVPPAAIGRVKLALPAQAATEDAGGAESAAVPGVDKINGLSGHNPYPKSPTGQLAEFIDLLHKREKETPGKVNITEAARDIVRRHFKGKPTEEAIDKEAGNLVRRRHRHLDAVKKAVGK